MKTTSKINNQPDHTLKMEILYQEINNIYKCLIPEGPFLGEKSIVVIHNPQNPISYTDHLPQFYLVGLTREGIIYDQLTYQYAHELCHIYADPRINNYLIESFCECMSFVILDKVYKNWLNKASIQDAEWYAVNFKNYVQNVINNYLIENEKTEDEIMGLNVVDLLSTLTSNVNRKINFILAFKIYTYYRTHPDILQLIPFLHYSTFENNLTPNGLFQSIIPNIAGVEENIPESLKVHFQFIKEQIS